MVVMLMFSLFCVVCDGPGYLPRKWDNDGATGGSPTLASTPQLVTCPRPGQLLPCAPCEGYEAPRSEHCARCGRCVLRRGHHCAALNVCIGQYNQVDSGSYVYVILIFCKTTPEELLGAAGLQPRRQHPGRRHQLLGPELLPQVTPAPSPQPPDLLTSCPRYLKVKGPEAAQEFIPKTSLWNLVFCTSLAVAVALLTLIHLAKQALATSLWFMI